MKKYISLFLCLCMIFAVSVSAGAANSNDFDYLELQACLAEGAEVVASKDMTTGEISYSTFEYEKPAALYSLGITGEVSEGWFPENTLEATDSSTYSIIGDDGRVEVSDTEAYPYSAICYIETKWPDGNTSLGTAWMIYSDIALTAGHCVYSSENGGWAKSVKLWPAKDGYAIWNNPYGTTTSKTLHAASQWTESQDGEYDWAVIELTDNIGDETGWFGIGWTSSDPTGTTVTITGYPGEHRYYQYKMSGKITRSSANKLYYNTIDTSGGQSGSPIYTAGNIAYGIHCHGANLAGENAGVRINEWRYNYFSSFKD